jgi:beta-catenin-like protein 1
MPDNPTPEMLKKLKMDSSSAFPSTPSASVPENDASSKARLSRAATVEDEDVDMDGERDLDFAPGGDADYFAEEDDEGRFFGGGLSKDQKEILNIFDKDAEDGVREDVRHFYTLYFRAQTHLF